MSRIDRTRSHAVLSALLLSAGAACAQTLSLTPLPGQNAAQPWSSPRAVSRDGSVVVGGGATSAGWEALRWVAGGPAQILGHFQGNSVSASASGVSGDGSVVVGGGVMGGLTVPFRWTQADGLTPLIGLPGVNSSARAVTDDGATVFGDASPQTPTGAPQPGYWFRWTAGAGSAVMGPGAVAGASSDGSVVAGEHQERLGASGPVVRHAFRWTAGTGARPLFAQHDGSTVTAVSADGRVIVGLRPAAGGGVEAYRWSEGRGAEVIDAGPAFSALTPMSVSGDGSVIVGHAGMGELGQEPWMWERGKGVRRLWTVLERRGLSVNPGVFGFEQATAVSADGATIAGWGTWTTFRIVAFVARVPRCPADLDDDGQNDFNDLLSFLNLYNTGSPLADFSEDGSVDFNDVLAFLNLFGTPCTGT